MAPSFRRIIWSMAVLRFSVLMLSEMGAEAPSKESTARDFVTDAFAHCKFIGYTPGSVKLIERSGVSPEADEGLIRLQTGRSISEFIGACRRLRLWPREINCEGPIACS